MLPLGFPPALGHITGQRVRNKHEMVTCVLTVYSGDILYISMLPVV